MLKESGYRVRLKSKTEIKSKKLYFFYENNRDIRRTMSTHCAPSSSTLFSFPFLIFYAIRYFRPCSSSRLTITAMSLQASITTGIVRYCTQLTVSFLFLSSILYPFWSPPEAALFFLCKLLPFYSHMTTHEPKLILFINQVCKYTSKILL